MDLLSGLNEIGFTEYEAKVYLALLSDYPATGYQVSKNSGVPRSMVYETLSRLHARGAVLEAIEGRATLYRPLPPQTLLDRYEERRQQLITDLREELEAHYSSAKENYVWSISGEQAIFSYAAQMLRGAESEAFLVMTDLSVDALQDEIAQASERGIAISTLLTGERELDLGRVARHPPLESQLQELTETLLIVVDRREALIADISHEATATITGNRNLVLIARQFVWMELFTQRVHAQLGLELLERLDPEDRQIFESLSQHEGIAG